jgi:hypothetical protein
VSRGAKKTGVEPTTLLDQRLVKALKHPLRAHVLNVLTQRAAGGTTLARELNEPPQKVLYHLEQLMKYGCIEPVDSVRKGGGVEVLYRATVRHFFDAAAWADVPDMDKLDMVMGVLPLVSEDLEEARIAETFVRPDIHLSRTPARLDAAGWAEVQVLLGTTLDELLKIRDRATTRMLKSDEKPRIAKIHLTHIETPDDQKI